MKKILFSAFALLILAGCQSFMRPPPPPDLAGKCFDSLDSYPDLAIIKDKVGLTGVNSQTIEMLANNQKPTSVEKVALLKWGSLRQSCIQIQQDWLSKYQSSNINVIVNIGIAESKQQLADLYAGKITYGEFAKVRQYNQNKINAEISAYQIQNQSYVDQQRQIDIQNLQQQQALSNQNQAINNQLLQKAMQPQNNQMYTPPPLQVAPLQLTSPQFTSPQLLPYQ